MRSQRNDRTFQVVSDINLLLILSLKLERPLSPAMEEKLTEIVRAELSVINVHLSSCDYRENCHIFKIASPPDVSPLAAASVLMEKAGPGLAGLFDELAGWGNIYHDRVFIKSGEEISSEQLSDLLNISQGGF